MSKLIGFLMIYSFILVGNVLADDKDLYDFLWLDPDKSVYVLQNKILEKEHSFYANLGFLKGLSTDFQKTKGFGARVGYFIREEWGVELIYHKFSNSNDEAFENIRTVNGVVPFVRRIKSYYGAMATWAPFYGKINTFNQIIYFDVIFGAGITKVQAESNTDSFRANDPANNYQKENYTSLAWKSEVRVYINERWHVDLGIYNNHYKAKGGLLNSTEKLRMNTDGSMSIGLSF